MTQFFNEFKKLYFLPIFGPFSIFEAKIYFFQKSGSVMHNNTWPPNNMLSFRKKLMSQFQENVQMEGQKHRSMEGWTDPYS